MSLINISNLTFGYNNSYDTIFENVSFQIDTDWKLGFTGRNGRGKTTFFNLLLGKYEYSGAISANVDFSYFPYEVKDKTKDTIEVVDEIYSGYELWELQKELSLLEVSYEVLYRPFETLSNGEQTKVLLAVLFLKENNFLLIDEPTNHLDYRARKIVSDYLNLKKGFILVSHDRAFLDNCIDHILSINKANIEIQRGNFSSWQVNKELQDNYEIKENEKRKKEIDKLNDAAKRMAGWSDKLEGSKIGTGAPDRGYIGHKAAKLMKRSKAIETRRNNSVEEKTKLLKNIETADDLMILPLPYYKDTLLEVKVLSVKYDGKTAVSGINFKLEQGDRLALCGKNGSGKSSILKLILGEKLEYDGYVNIGSYLVMSYISQEASNLIGSIKDFSRNENIDESLLMAILRKLDFSRVQFEKDMKDYSGGQKKKVLLAASLCHRAHLYVWDEPLNYIDIISRMQIEELILKFQPTMIFVEHDSAFLDHIATKRVEL